MAISKLTNFGTPFAWYSSVFIPYSTAVYVRATFCCTFAHTVYLCLCVSVCVCVCVCVCEWLSYNIYHFIKWHYQLHLCKQFAVCLLWGWIFKYYSRRIHGLNGWLITSRHPAKVAFYFCCARNTSKHSAVSYCDIMFWTLISVSSRSLIDMLAVKLWLTLCLPHPPVYFL